MTPARRRSLVVGVLLGLATTFVAVAIIRSLVDDGTDATLSDPGAAQIPAIATQGDVIGDAVPNDTYDRLGGGEFRFAELAGSPIVVNLWASWCGPCVAEMPDFEAVHQRVGDRVAFVGVNHSDGEGPARELAERTGVTYPLVRDPRGSFAAALEVARMPTTLFVDAGGRVVGVHPGELSAADLEAELDRLFPAGSP